MKTLRIVVALVFFSASFVSAQRGGTGGGMHGGGHMGGGGAHSGGGHISSGGGSGFHGNINYRGFHGHSNRYYGYGYAGYWPIYGAYGGYWDTPWNFTDPGPEDQGPYPQQQANASPAVVVVQSQPPAPYVPPASPKLVDVPQDGAATPAAKLPPAVFVLANGERIESDRYVLSARSLNVDVGRQQRTIPLSDVNLDATLAVNQQRGLNLIIPRDPNSIVLGF